MNGYVPYDVTYLNRMFETVKSAIGNATNWGILMFGIITAFAVVVLIIRKFTK